MRSGLIWCWPITAYCAGFESWNTDPHFSNDVPKLFFYFFASVLSSHLMSGVGSRRTDIDPTLLAMLLPEHGCNHFCGWFLRQREIGHCKTGIDGHAWGTVTTFDRFDSIRLWVRSTVLYIILLLSLFLLFRNFRCYVMWCDVILWLMIPLSLLHIDSSNIW